MISRIQNHHLRVKNAIHIIQSSEHTEEMKYFAQCFLDVLASKNGNDILEQLFVECTGRSIKSITKKHGADSEDGLLESKPLKCKYSAHISDDTPASLLRHHTIPYIVIGEATPNGQSIKWVLYTSYRIFDQSRFTKMRNNLPLDEQQTIAELLPTIVTERYKILSDLKKIWKPKNYIRSNPLPIQDICKLKEHEFTLWINSELNQVEINKDILKLHQTYPNSVLSDEYMKPSVDMRIFCLDNV
jgi:hypothetical protein